MYHITNPANVIAPKSWYFMKVQLMAQPRCICSEHILSFDSWNSQWQSGMSLITVVWATRVRLHHASQLAKVDSWQILQWSCCWSVVSGKWGLTKLQLCPSSSVGCLQTVHDWSTVGPLAPSLLQIKIIAGTCCSLSSIQAAILPVVGDAAAPPCAGEHSSPADSVPPWPSLWQMSPDKGFSPCTAQRGWRFLQMLIKGQMHVCNITHCSVFSIFLIIRGTKRSTIKLVFCWRQGRWKREGM